MAYIRVAYRNKNFDYVSTKQLATLLARKEITHFYRPSEKRWVNVRIEDIRGMGGLYNGPNRRMEDSAHMKEEKRLDVNNEDEDWLTNLWKDFEKE